MAGQVFISYSRRDDAAMRRVVAFLRKQGINVWVDNEKLVPGTPIWEEEIEKAIKAAGAIVVVMSPDSKNSEWVRREISLAEQNRVRIFPVLVSGDEDSAITIRLITKQFVDLRQNEETGLASLSATLSSYLGELNHSLEQTEEIPVKLAESKEQIPEKPKKRSFTSWQGRTLLGGIVGALLIGTWFLVYNDYSYYGTSILISVTICAAAGFVTYPHKASIVLWIVGFLVTGFFDQEEFLAVGGLFGFPAGAVLSRILHWIKVIK